MCVFKFRPSSKYTTQLTRVSNRYYSFSVGKSFGLESSINGRNEEAKRCVTFVRIGIEENPLPELDCFPAKRVRQQCKTVIRVVVLSQTSEKEKNPSGRLGTFRNNPNAIDATRLVGKRDIGFAYTVINGRHRIIQNTARILERLNYGSNRVDFFF